MDDPLVPPVGRNDPHIHSTLCRQRQSGYHTIIHNEIGRVDIDIVLGLIEDLKIDVLAYIFRIQRAVGIGLYKPFPETVQGCSSHG